MKMDEIMHYHCLINAQQQEQAIKELEQKRKEDPDIYINYLLIKAYNSIGKKEESVKIIETSKISKEKQQIMEARLDLENDDVEKAIKKYRKIVNTTNNIDAIQTLGNIENQKGNIEAARYYFEKLLEMNPENYMALHGLANLEMKEKNYDAMEKIYLHILEIAHTKTLAEENVRKSRMQKIALTCLTRLEIKRENYQKAYEYLLQLTKLDYIVYKDFNREMIYLKSKLGLMKTNKKELEKLSYFESQIVKYSEAKAIEHISSHTQQADNKRKHSVFEENIDFVKLFNIAKEKIQDEEPISFSMTDNYIIILDHPIGTLNGKQTNKLKVATEINTKNIITLYLIPAHYEEYNEKKKENTYQGKMRQRTRKSQIDKFNQKYGQY